MEELEPVDIDTAHGDMRHAVDTNRSLRIGQSNGIIGRLNGEIDHIAQFLPGDLPHGGPILSFIGLFIYALVNAEELAKKQQATGPAAPGAAPVQAQETTEQAPVN
jgi:hypothetical protein